MRAHCWVSSLVAVMLTAASGCRPADEPVAVALPEPTVPEPAPAPSPRSSQAEIGELLHSVENVGGPSQAQEGVNVLREGTPVFRGPAVPTRVLDRLIYQCADDVTFAVRIVGDKLQAFPPGYSNGYIVLDRVASDDGVHYATIDASFRAKDDLATLRVKEKRYVDCVSNPAAAVWQALVP